MTEKNPFQRASKCTRIYGLLSTRPTQDPIFIEFSNNVPEAKYQLTLINVHSYKRLRNLCKVRIYQTCLKPFLKEYLYHCAPTISRDNQLWYIHFIIKVTYSDLRRPQELLQNGPSMTSWSIHTLVFPSTNRLK